MAYSGTKVHYVHASSSTMCCHSKEVVAYLSIQGGSGVVRGHGMVGHGPPWVILGGRLGVPYITSVPSELTRLQSLHHGVCVNDLATGGVNKVAALLEVLEHGLVEEVLCARVKRGVDGDDVTLLDQVGGVLDVASIQLLLQLGW